MRDMWIHCIICLEGTEVEYKTRCALSLTSVLDGNGCSTPRPDRITPGMDLYPLYRRLGGHQGRSGQGRKLSLPQAFDPRDVHPVASSYTYWAIPAHVISQWEKQSNYRPGQTLRILWGWGSQILRQSAHEGGKVVSLTHRPPLPPGNIPGTHFC